MITNALYAIAAVGVYVIAAPSIGERGTAQRACFIALVAVLLAGAVR